MLSLFLSTFNDYVIVGLIKDNKLLSLKEKKSISGHSSLIVPTIDEILKENSLTPKDLNEIIVISGPGSFTGVRLGITVAKTLAYALSIPIKTISSIEAIATNFTSKEKIISLSDSKGKYLGYFLNNKLQEMIYLNNTLASEYFEKHPNAEVFDQASLNLEKIYDYVKNIEPTPAHAVKALYVKEIEALNGR